MYLFAPARQNFLCDNTGIKILCFKRKCYFPDFTKGPLCTYCYLLNLGALLRPILLWSDANFF